MTDISSREKKINIYDEYRQVFDMPELTNAEIDELRKPFILLARTICERVCGKRFY